MRVERTIRMDEDSIGDTALIEAGLYVAGRPLGIKILGSLMRSRSEEKARECARALACRYDSMKSAIQIIELKDGRFVMQLRPEYVEKVKKLVRHRLLLKGPLKTLSFIAFKQPVTQAYVTKVRGKPAYKHIKKLIEMGLVSEEKLGRTSILRTTETFADYFNLDHNYKVMKKQLEKLFEKYNL